MKIICDTNIWYDYGYNNRTIEDTKVLPLAPTYLSITELLITEGMFRTKPKKEYKNFSILIDCIGNA